MAVAVGVLSGVLLTVLVVLGLWIWRNRTVADQKRIQLLSAKAGQRDAALAQRNQLLTVAGALAAVHGKDGKEGTKTVRVPKGAMSRAEGKRIEVEQQPSGSVTVVLHKTQAKPG